MKKQILCGSLALTMLLGTATASFTDVSDPGVQQAAAVLYSLGVMEGEGGDRFNPDGLLTRAQFCKLVVTALGVTDVSPYENYTVFPDVPTSHWAAGYVNAALKQTDLRKKQVIRGFADGSFGPDKTISYGEVCTMLLRMLEFNVEDVGPFWPSDYIAKAEALNLNRNVRHYGASDIVRRGDAAILLLNTLQTAPKEGSASGKLLHNLVASNTIEDSILLSTSETDSDLRKGQARFYEGGALQTRSIADEIDRSLIGTRGTVLFDKTSTSKVRAFVPENSDNERITVKRAYADRIETADGKYKIPTKTPVVLNGELVEYGKAWPDITPDYEMNVFYGAGREIDLLSAAVPTAGASSFVYGTLGGINVPASYTITKNGVNIDLSKLKQYDLVSLNAESKTAIVSDKRITGYLQEASPSYAHPSKVTVMGHEFSIPEHASGYFSSMKYNDRVTLLLDHFGTVQAAYPADAVSSENIGVFTASEKNGATVQMLAGVNVSGKIDEESAMLTGRMVRVSVDKSGKLSLSAYSGSAASGNWSVSGRTIGSNVVAPNVKLYEQVAERAPVTAISDSDLHLDSVNAKDIRAAILDSAGSVTAIVLNDVTGHGWQYGIASKNMSKTDLIPAPASKENDKEYMDDYRDNPNNYNYEYTVEFKTFDNGDFVTKKYSLYNDTAFNSTGGFIGIPKGMDQMSGKIGHLPVKQIKVVGAVGLDAFDGTKGVKTASGYYSLPDDIGVYVPSYNKFIPLSEAKTNFSRFTIYGETLVNGGIVHMITTE